MEFWLGLITGTIVGANIGIVIAGLLGGAKRVRNSEEYLWDQLHMEQAVLDEDHLKAPRRGHSSQDGTPEAAAHF